MDRCAVLSLLILTIVGCGAGGAGGADGAGEPGAPDKSEDAPAALRGRTAITTAPAPVHVRIERDITLGDYFDFVDSIVRTHAELGDTLLAEHVLVRANPWLIEALASTDYYQLKARGITSLDPQAETVLRAGDSLRIPDTAMSDSLRRAMRQTVIDINVPEFRLRVVEDERTLFEFPVRVGQDGRQYLAMAGRTVDLRTRVGEGSIVRIERNPRYVNPRDNHEYFQTRRDDDVVTKLPRIPFLEPELDGVRYGQLIHPTTNPETLGQAYSNGCIGLAESAAWYTYYFAPIGTRVHVRYDLEVEDTVTGTVSRLPDIYSREKPETDGALDLPSGPDALHDACEGDVS